MSRQYTQCAIEGCEHRFLKGRRLEQPSRLRRRWEEQGIFGLYPAGTAICAYHHAPAVKAPCPRCAAALWLYKKFSDFGWIWIDARGREISHVIDAGVFLRGSSEAVREAFENGPQYCPKCKELLPKGAPNL